MDAARVSLIPMRELSPGQAGKIRNQVITNLITMVSQKLKCDPGQLVIRDIRPQGDLDYSVEDWGEITGATADAFETMSEGTMGDNRWVAIYGVKTHIDRCNCSQIKVSVGNAERTIWSLMELTADENGDMVGFSPMAAIIPENTVYTISRYVRIANASAEIALKGFVCEKRGILVSP